MRAKLSTGSKRHYIVEPDEDGVCDIIPGVTPYRTLYGKQALAMAEARAILAETERGTWTWPDIPSDYVIQELAPAYHALAEALSAFVAE